MRKGIRVFVVNALKAEEAEWAAIDESGDAEFDMSDSAGEEWVWEMTGARAKRPWREGEEGQSPGSWEVEIARVDDGPGGDEYQRLVVAARKLEEATLSPDFWSQEEGVREAIRALEERRSMEGEHSIRDAAKAGPRRGV